MKKREPLSENHKLKISLSLKGKKKTPEHRQKVINAKIGKKRPGFSNKGTFKKGTFNDFAFKKGHVHSKEVIEKIRLKNTGRHHAGSFKNGENHPNWKNGISKNTAHFKRIRREREEIAGGHHTKGEWEVLKKQYGYRCPSCRETEPKVKLTKDHIIPVSKGGSGYIENIQPLCKRCNSRKRDKITRYNMSNE